MANNPNAAANLTPFKPGQSGNPKGKPKGTKHINTWIQELLNDEEFVGQVQEGLQVKEYKGAPIKAIIKAQIRLAINGDTKAADMLFKHGGVQKQEIDITSNGETVAQPIDGNLLNQFLNNVNDNTKR